MEEKMNVGDTVTRWLAGTIPMDLVITAITEDRIICGAWEFDKKTGGEIDEDLGLPEGMVASYIKMPGMRYVQAEQE